MEFFVLIHSVTGFRRARRRQQQLLVITGQIQLRNWNSAEGNTSLTISIGLLHFNRFHGLKLDSLVRLLHRCLNLCIKPFTPVPVSNTINIEVNISLQHTQIACENIVCLFSPSSNIYQITLLVLFRSENQQNFINSILN